MFQFAKKLKDLFAQKKASDDFFEDLTDNLIEGDVGPKVAFKITGELEKKCKSERLHGTPEIIKALKSLLSLSIKDEKLTLDNTKKNLFLVLGVNGVGKTTTVAKLANYYKERGTENIVLASADTFRAGAIEQLAIHAERLGVRVVSHESGSDSASVVFDGAGACFSHGAGLVLADTAGRLHNKENLMRELQKIDKVSRMKCQSDVYKKLLVLDATTGQNALRQAEVFNEMLEISGVVLTKYDSTAKGGVVITLGSELSLPVFFVGDGEKYENIHEFDKEKFLNDFIGEE